MQHPMRTLPEDSAEDDEDGVLEEATTPTPGGDDMVSTDDDDATDARDRDAPEFDNDAPGAASPRDVGRPRPAPPRARRPTPARPSTAHRAAGPFF